MANPNVKAAGDRFVIPFEINEGAFTRTTSERTDGTETDTVSWANPLVKGDFVVPDGSSSTNFQATKAASDGTGLVIGFAQNKPQDQTGDQTAFDATEASPQLRTASIVLMGIQILIVVVGTGGTLTVGNAAQRHATEDQTWIDAGALAATDRVVVLAGNTAGGNAAILVGWYAGWA